jgi:SAM-dependent methyltransferase
MSDNLPLPDSIRDEMERIYTEMSPAEIPWNIESPPRQLVDLVESSQVRPCKTIDLGCGAGNYAVYLASQGFDVTGVDVSSAAIALARDNARRKGVKCEFLVVDILEGLNHFTDTFEFAHEWSVLHHIYPESREQHVETVHRVLIPGGKYFSVCFSDKDAAFGGTGKIRRTPIGTVLCFSSEKELRQLFEPYFRVLTMKTAEVQGKMGPHLMNVALMEKQG